MTTDGPALSFTAPNKSAVLCCFHPLPRAHLVARLVHLVTIPFAPATSLFVSPLLFPQGRAEQQARGGEEAQAPVHGRGHAGGLYERNLAAQVTSVPCISTAAVPCLQ